MQQNAGQVHERTSNMADYVHVYLRISVMYGYRLQKKKKQSIDIFLFRIVLDRISIQEYFRIDVFQF